MAIFTDLATEIQTAIVLHIIRTAAPTRHFDIDEGGLLMEHTSPTSERFEILQSLARVNKTLRSIVLKVTPGMTAEEAG